MSDAAPEQTELDPGVIWPKDRRVRTDDGAELAYTFLGPADGPVVALCSGFLCPDTWWAELAPTLADAGYRVLVFHYRGVASSTLPREPGWHGRGLGREALSIERFAADLRTIADHEGIAELAVAGHSMGSQVALEAYRQMPGRVRAIVSLTGPYASPVRTLFGFRRAGVALYAATLAAFLLTPPPVLRTVWRQAWRLPIPQMAKLMGVVAPRCPNERLDTFVDHGAWVDPYVAMATTSGMHAHSAEDLLPEIDVPVLVVVGGVDPFSPPSLGRHMAERIPDATLRTVPRGSHGALLEYPELVNGWVLDFLDANRARR
ncbi:MAG TPA: alpha/beta hydrolase [Egibacteraceae bacterium]|nr:alpha/beta hydrolase [Egibacteraceae bacterium]